MNAEPPRFDQLFGRIQLFFKIHLDQTYTMSGLSLVCLDSTNQRASALLSVTMKSAATFAIVLVTMPDLKTARALTRSALHARLIACANLIPKIESHYWWRGKMESGAEVLLILKTQKSKLVALEKLVFAKHPYHTPEFLVLPLNAGSKRYLVWLTQNS
jgi:periplasmic divalent cation tolerance protein